MGVVGTVLNLAIMATMLGLGSHYLLAAVVATEVTILTNFVLQEWLVFHDLRHHSRRQSHRLLAAVAFNNVETLARLPFVVLLVEYLVIPGVLAQAVTLAVAFVARFLFLSRVVYRPRMALVGPEFWEGPT